MNAPNEGEKSYAPPPAGIVSTLPALKYLIWS